MFYYRIYDIIEQIKNRCERNRRMKKIAVLGFGVVGSGTVEVFYKNKEALEKKAGDDLDLTYIHEGRD